MTLKNRAWLAEFENKTGDQRPVIRELFYQQSVICYGDTLAGEDDEAFWEMEEIYHRKFAIWKWELGMA